MRLPHQEFIPLVLSALERNQQAKFTITGSSMVPFIFPNDVIVLGRKKYYQLGEVVLFEFPSEIFAVHRIVQRADKGVWIRGDAQYHKAGPVPYDSIYGKVISVTHKGKIRVFTKEPWRVAGLLWILLFPLSTFLVDLLLFFRKKIQLGLSHLSEHLSLLSFF